MSTAGGPAQAIERGLGIGCQAIQIFTKNNMQWSGPPILPSAAEEFRRARDAAGISPVFSHNCYLINLGATNPVTLKKSIAAMIDEVERADLLGLPFVVTHPGSHLGSGETAGLKRIADSLLKVLAATQKSSVKVALETTAGQGTNLGHRFEHLAELLRRTDQPSRMAICVDTCHIFAAGYDIRTEAGYQSTLLELDKLVGLDQVVAFHVNDSKTDFASRVDRHEHIGQGKIGLTAFRCLVNDPRFQKIPMILETPKGPDLAEDLMNLDQLRKLAE
jgi:deoxyribonuclease-4